VVGVVIQDGDECGLYMRKQDIAYKGSPAWAQTCVRLGLPLPPVDPTLKVYTDWSCVYRWAAGTSKEVLGFQGDSVWLREGDRLLSLTADGGSFTLPI